LERRGGGDDQRAVVDPDTIRRASDASGPRLVSPYAEPARMISLLSKLRQNDMASSIESLAMGLFQPL
jgi:hypothetical protein